MPDPVLLDADLSAATGRVMQPAKTTDLTSPARRELPTRGRCNRASGNAGQQAGRLSYLLSQRPADRRAGRTTPAAEGEKPRD